MIHRRATALAALAALLVAAACGGSDRGQQAGAGRPEAPTPNGGPAIAAAPTATTDAKGCVHDGRWRPCGFVDRLERSGFVVETRPDTVRYEFLAPTGVRYSLGRGEAQAFFYEDTTALARDVAGLDTLRVAPKGTTRHWDLPAALVRSGNLLVIVLSGNEHLVERVQLAVEAGAPQPELPAAPQALAPSSSH